MIYSLYSLGDTEQLRTLEVTGKSSYALFINNSMCKRKSI